MTVESAWHSLGFGALAPTAMHRIIRKHEPGSRPGVEEAMRAPSAIRCGRADEKIPALPIIRNIPEFPYISLLWVMQDLYHQP